MAIYLIYPSRGLLESHLQSIDYIAASGYSPLVVSNLPLQDCERKVLLMRSWKFIERSNFGYDFGGYRDAILILSEELSTLDRLVILNDSVWFPVSEKSDWIKDAEKIDCDFVGAASNYAVSKEAKRNLTNFRWEYSEKNSGFHYCSFALSVGHEVLSSQGFLKYWKNLRLTNDKEVTIQRGEIGLSQWVVKKGFTHGSTLDISRLDLELEELEYGQVYDIANHLIIPEDDTVLRLKKRIFSSQSISKDDLITLILVAVARQGASYAIPFYSILHHNFSFLKKSPAWLSYESAATTKQVVALLSDPYRAVIEAEIDRIETSNCILQAS
ncbi:MAG: rhamnan synthesis F family protein [Rhodobacterales bacterium]